MSTLAARRGVTPLRWWCDLHGHRWDTRTVWTRTGTDPWEPLHHDPPAVVCVRCRARQPWESAHVSEDQTVFVS